MNLTTTLATTVAGTALAAVLLGGAAAVPAAAATPTPTPSRSTVPCGAVLDRLPDALQDDLAALRELPREQRVAAALEIRQDVRDGVYGARVQRWAERWAERWGQRREAWFATLPAQLQRDLTAARALPEADRPAAYADIARAALAGDYGARVEAFAERVQQRRALCS